MQRNFFSSWRSWNNYSFGVQQQSLTRPNGLWYIARFRSRTVLVVVFARDLFSLSSRVQYIRENTLILNVNLLTLKKNSEYIWS
jgi:hypothetical protein